MINNNECNCNRVKTVTCFRYITKSTINKQDTANHINEGGRVRIEPGLQGSVTNTIPLDVIGAQVQQLKLF